MKPETVNEHMQALGESIVRYVDYWLQLNKIDNEIVGFHWDMRYSSCVSNSHSHPHNGVRNWGGQKEGAPRGYPGFDGRVWIRYAKPCDFGNANEPLSQKRLYTGTGGAGSYSGPWSKLEAEINKHRMDNMDSPSPKLRMNDRIHCYSWDARIFMADLDAQMAEKIEMEMFLAIMNSPDGRFKTQAFSHHFKWDDPMTFADDNRRLNPFSVEYGL